MELPLKKLFLLLLLPLIIVGNKPTLYEYFTGDSGIQSGLVANSNRSFTLNGKDIRLISGSLHYFRLHPDYWNDRLAKFRAAGLNAVDVYVPWNLHQPMKGVTDFGDKGFDFSDFLDLRRFLQSCKDNDLFVIFRPGPYICGEWEFGGMPSWLLSEYPMSVRTSSRDYEEPAFSYLKEVIDRVKDLQFYSTRNGVGGPIIMVQIENEYGNFGYGNYPRDKPHLKHIRSVLEEGGIEALFFNSDNIPVNHDYGHIEGALLTSNLGAENATDTPNVVTKSLDALLAVQPDKPLLVSEFWTGWFDHWFVPFRSDRRVESFESSLEAVLGPTYNASVNFYMFFGGTNFGFMNGGNAIEIFPYDSFDVTSYDYGAPISECGNYTEKYRVTERLVDLYDPLAQILNRPQPPEFVKPIAYQDVSLDKFLSYSSIVDGVDTVCNYPDLRPMEMFDCLNEGNGQSYGYAVYRKELTGLKTGDKLKIKGRIHDLLIVMINGVMVTKTPIVSILDTLVFGSWGLSDSELTLDVGNVPVRQDGKFILDLWVENLGRINYGKPHVLDAQRKGLWEGPVLINEEILEGDWSVIPLEFKSDWIKGIDGWSPRDGQINDGPAMLKGEFMVNRDQMTNGIARDSFLDLSGWLHGVVFVNGFNLGRYFKGGPQKSLYVPGPILKEGFNEIVVVESYQSGKQQLAFSTHPIYAPTHYIGQENFEEEIKTAFAEARRTEL